MAGIEKILEEMRRSPQAIAFNDLLRVCEHHFGKYRTAGSHHIFKMPWAGDPRINIQRIGSKAKEYQVKQVLAAIDRLQKEKED